MGTPLIGDKARWGRRPALRRSDQVRCGTLNGAPNWTDLPGEPTYAEHAKRTIHRAGMMEIRQALTFDDVMLVPAASSILPGDTDTRTRITREIELGIPLISAAMDTVTEGALAIAMAQAGGLGVIRRNMPIESQAAEVPQGQEIRSRHGRQPGHDPSGRDLGGRAPADGRVQDFRHSRRRARQSAAWLGILTNRDVQFASNSQQPVDELMTPRQTGHGARERLSRGREAPVASAPDREAAGRRWRLSLHRPDHGQGYREGAAFSAGRERRAWQAAGRRRRRHRPPGA